MGYVGTAPLSGDYRKLDDISGSFNGSTTEFDLEVGSVAVTPPKETTLLISVGGILQEPVSAYTVANDKITFTSAPAADSDFFGILLGDTMAIGTPSDGTITGAKVASAGLLATDIKIGEDSQTMIDFETANEIHFDADNAERVKIDSTGLNIVSGSLETATIDYTDGDLAMTIADGGGVTFAQNATFSGIIDITDTTDSSDDSGDTGALRVEGGASIAKKLYVGTDLDVDGTAELDNITVGGAQGSDGQVLTSTGSGVGWEDAASTTVAFTASGTIATGDHVALNSNGTVSVAGSSAKAKVEYEDGGCLYLSSCYDTANNKVVIAYLDDANSDYGTAVVGTISGGAITFGTPVVFESAAVYYMTASFDSNVNKVVIAYRDTPNNNYGTAVVGAVSGTSISFGTPTVFEDSHSTYITSCFDSNSNRVVIGNRDYGNSSYGTAVVAAAAADNSIAFGTPVVFESANSNLGQMESMAFDSDTNRFVIAYADGGDSDHGRAVVGSVDNSDNSIDFGTPVEFEGAEVNNTGVAYDTNADKIVICYRDQGDSGYGKAIVGTVTGGGTNSISFGTASSAFDTGGGSYFHQIAFDPSVNKVIVVYKDSGNSNYGTYSLGTVSGTSITFESEVVFQNSNISYTYPLYDPDSGFIVVAFNEDADSHKGKAVLIDSSVANNYTSWIGIAGTGVSDGASLQVNLLGTINENQSSLTVGSKYYMQNDGSVTTTVVSGREVGMATAATKMLVTQGSITA